MTREGDVAVRLAGASPPSFLADAEFPGKRVCCVCGLPFTPHAGERVCMACSDEVVRTAQQVLTGEGSWRRALRDVRQKGRPFVLDVAETVMEKLGGPEKLAERLATDFMRARGEGLSPEQAVFHQPDVKVLKGLYELLKGLMDSRDELVDDSDPFDGMSEEQLMQVASNAAMLRIENDAGFRDDVLATIARVDATAITRAAIKVLSAPTVEVIYAPPRPFV